MNNKIGLLFIRTAVLATFLAVGCTKKVPYKYENKEKVHSKSEIADVDYLYVASTANSSRSSSVARPYWQGEEKLVRLKFTENSLQVVEVDRENRFSANQTNNKLVLEIPVDHIQYKCAEDAHGECTQTETTDNDLNWKNRSNFKPNFDSIKVTEKSMLPIELENLFTGGCYAEVDSKFLGYELKADKINITYEKTFNANIDCLTSLNKLSDLTFSQVYHYSLARLDKLASKDFKPVSYPTNDENTFGFFTTEHTKLDVDNNSTENDKVVLMNHWNPNKKVLDYYMSIEFNKKENAAIKNATELAVRRINEGLADAGVNLSINLKTNDGSVIPGDITKSMIILVEDPSSSGVLGYGPSVANPLTGEIMSARTVMYKGILEQYIKYTYEEIRQAKIAENNSAKKGSTKTLVDPRLLKAIPSQAAENKSTQSNVNAKNSKQEIAGKAKKAVPVSAIVAKNIQLAEKQIKNYTKNVGISQKDYMFAASKHCLYSPEAISVDEKVKNDILKVMGDELTSWEDLASSSKQEAIDILLPAAYLPTLIHELGHNLGLRHNFAGSEDQNNFYSKEELARQGIGHEIPYSSVMEYGASELDLLTHLGKYDKAALKFAYNREVETADNQTVKVESTLEDLLAKNASLELKSFKYCTDENVGANPGCKRFDAGVTYTEIAQQLIRDYESKYYLRNFRNKRLNFSLYGDVSYASRIDYTFDNLRTFFEVRERIKHDFNLDDNAAEWESIPFLKDLNDAVKLSAQFFINVLKTPDLTCAIAPAAQPNQIIALMPLANLSKSAASCEEAQLNPAYKVVGSFGKLFQSKKSENSTNAYIDQIDVRGIWVDKVLAANYLFARKTGSFNFDKRTDNYTDLPVIGDEVINTVFALAMNQAETEVTIRDASGVELASGLAQVDTFRTHTIEESISAGIAKALGVPASESLFTQKLLSTAVMQSQNLLSAAGRPRMIADLFKVYKTNITAAVDPDLIQQATSVVIGDARYTAKGENELAATIITNLNIASILAGAPEGAVDSIVDSRRKNLPAPSEEELAQLTPSEQFLWTADLAMITNHLNLGMSEKDLEDLLNTLPKF